MSEPRRSFWTTSNGLAAIVLIGITGYYLLAEHQAHVFAALPWLVLLLCPLMHVFMHRGHGGHGGHGRWNNQNGIDKLTAQPQQI